MSSNTLAPLQIKATKDGFTLVPEPGASLESIVAYLELRLKESQEFFRNSEMTLDLRAKPLKTDEIAHLQNILAEQVRVKVVEVRLADDLSFVLERTLPPDRMPPRAPVQTTEDTAPVIVRNTCRSGTRIESASDCVVLGDVNPGAEIVAVGDVIVFGKLRGIAHAGALGNRSAKIWALSIEPSQIRIADLVALPPRANKRIEKRFEIAEVQEDLIEVITM